MALLGYSRSIARKSPENVRDVQAKFDDVRAYLTAGKLTGAENFKVDALVAANFHNPLGAFDVPKFSAEITPFGVVGNVVASYVLDDRIITTGAGTYSRFLSTTGAVAADLVFAHYAWKINSGPVGGKGFGVGYGDGTNSFDVDTNVVRPFVGSSFGWGAGSPGVAPISAPWYGLPVGAGAGTGQFTFYVFDDGSTGALDISIRARVAVLRSA